MKAPAHPPTAAPAPLADGPVSGRDPRRVAIGVVIVTFNAADVIVECLDSLFADRPAARVVVVDNGSTDGTVAAIGGWARGQQAFVRPPHSPLVGHATATVPVAFAHHRDFTAAPLTAGLTLIDTGFNGGFAFAVNRGLELWLRDPALDLLWVLNPDCAVLPGTADALVAEADRGPFAILGMRQLYYDAPDRIQTDGLRLSRRTGVCHAVNGNRPLDQAPPPDARQVDIISGAAMVVPRAFIDRAGLMEEDYFLYYEEADWALRRGDLPLRLARDCIVYHHGGTAIGTGTFARRPSPFANYFNYRNRLRFARRFLPGSMGRVRLYALAKAAQLYLKRAPDEGWAIVTAVLGLRAPRAIRDRFADPRARAMALGEKA